MKCWASKLPVIPKNSVQNSHICSSLSCVRFGMRCQICYDEVASTTAGDDVASPFLVTKLCGDSCPSHLCSSCLVRHVQVTLKKYYAGLLPKVKCPICLTFMASNRWKPHLMTKGKTESEKFETLCRQTCAFRPPCCHRTIYTHLPAFQDRTRKILVDGVELEPTDTADASLTLLNHKRQSKADQFARIIDQLSAFSDHKPKSDSSVTIVNDFLDLFTADEANESIDVNKAFMRMLQIVQDSERRATLLLAFLFKRPQTETLCCKTKLCFNCKRTEPHEVCDENPIDMDKCLVQCRSCRATILKVAGCDSVVCLCGFSMGWGRELQLKQNELRGLYPVSINEVVRFEAWLSWSARIKQLSPWFLVAATRWAFRNYVSNHDTIRPRMREAVRKWKFWRWQRIVTQHLTQEPSQKRLRLQATEVFLAKVGQNLEAISSQHVWYMRWKSAMVSIRKELFWKCYWRDHPEDLASTSKENNDFFSSFDV